MEVSLFDIQSGIYRFVETGLTTLPHAHPALEILIAREGHFSLTSQKGTCQRAKAAIIKPGKVHTLQSNTCVCEIILIESFVGSYWAIADLLGLKDITEDVLCLDDECIQGKERVAHIREIARHGLLESYTKDNTGGKSEDRVYRCMDYIHTHIADDCLSLPVLAEYVHLSPDRLSHVFRKTMGIPLQRYIIWARLKRAVQIALTNGIDLTEAAFAAGFYDSAHFSRKFKDFFGVKPSAVYNSRIVQVL